MSFRSSIVFNSSIFLIFLTDLLHYLTEVTHIYRVFARNSNSYDAGIFIIVLGVVRESIAGSELLCLDSEELLGFDFIGALMVI